ncbi:MAG: RagB/SusD family nutrient uptake outer membrane protein, partial [Tidjanibacter sp.]|nr:RagB/SusD family nutrient uptake outer membrane protein [Tidjanibacter sp.]
YDQLYREAGHSRFLWPIPKTEIDANPQIKNQQNDGY